MLDVRETSKVYQKPEERIVALRDVSAHVSLGEVVALQGPSGSGKTTLLLAAGGLLTPDGGRIVVDGQDVYSLAPNARARLRAAKIGFVFQQYHLIPYLNALENVLAPVVASPAPDARKRALRLVERFGLSDRASHVPAELSAGECQRVALARALFNKPSLLLADEPTGNLDEGNAKAVLDSLADFAKGGGAVLLVTHDESVAQCADRVLHIEKGSIRGE